MTLWEKYAGTTSSSASTWAWEVILPLPSSPPKRSGSENAGHSSALPQPRLSL